MGNVFQWIFDNLKIFAPWFIVMSFDWGVVWRFGNNPSARTPGFHWRIPFVDTIETVPATPTYLEIPIQSVITRDGKLVCFATMLGYKVFDPVKHFCEVDDFPEATVSAAKAHLAARVRASDYSELTGSDGLKTLERSLQGTLTTKLKAWGTEVTDVGFIDFAEVPWQARIFGIENLVSGRDE